MQSITQFTIEMYDPVPVLQISFIFVQVLNPKVSKTQLLYIQGIA